MMKHFYPQKFPLRILPEIHMNKNAADMILHCMNHSSFHRGQVINMFRQLEFESIPRTDIIYFLSNKKSQA